MHRRHGFGIVLLLLAVGCQLGSRTSNPARLNRIAGVYDKGDTKAAIDQLNSYVKDFPKDDLAWTILGHACEDEGRDAEARVAYETALSINPRRAEAHVGMALIQRKEGHPDDAMRSFGEALAIDPRNAEAYSSMTMIALERGQDAQALEYARKGYELDSKSAVIAANLAVAYHYNGDLENRDRLTQVAASLGYEKMNSLRRIYSGEITVRRTP